MTDTHPHHLFVYGTLKEGNGNNPLIHRYGGIYLGPAVTVDKFVLNDDFPFVFKAPVDFVDQYGWLGRVRGDLYRVTDEGLKACDWLEGHPTSYCRTPTEVDYLCKESGKEGCVTVTAGIYLMGWKMRNKKPQVADANGILEWGRGRAQQARDFQRGSSSVYRDR